MPKRKRESTAAYAASQPLFAALKNGCDKLELQQSTLSEARDLVQHLHVKLDHVTLKTYDHALGPDHHERYVDCILAAWAANTEVYRDIFEQLAHLTSADPAEGREASADHDDFKRMFSSAQEANGVVVKLNNSRESTKVKTSRANNTEHNVQTSPTLRSSKNRSMEDAKSQRPSKVRKLVADMPETRLTPTSSQDAGSTHHAQQASAQDVNEVEDRPSGIPIEPKTYIKDGVRYEDVSTEVAARLQAKEAKKLAEKAEKSKKKRKRESVDSAKKDCKDSIADITNRQLPERPQRKKSKRISSADVDSGQKRKSINSAQSMQKLKRQAEVAVSVKKRKKA